MLPVIVTNSSPSISPKIKDAYPGMTNSIQRHANRINLLQ